jgi:predicted ATPase/DNA-binding SARP family transcriptional activator
MVPIKHLETHSDASHLGIGWEMNARLEITTLGELSIRLSGEPVVGLSTRKVEALLVYLACNPGEHSREVLATLLWEDHSQTQALASLRSALANLRKHLKPYILSTRSRIGIDPEADIWLDIEALDKSIKARNIAVVSELYHGDFLQGFYIRGSSGFEQWTTSERERHRHLAHQSIHSLVDQLLHSNDYQACISHIYRLLEIDPLDESAQRKLMIGLSHLGQRSQALTSYREFQEYLWDELAVEPEEATRDLHSQIKAGELKVQLHPEPSLVIPDLSPPDFLQENGPERESQVIFVSREAELGQLNAFLDQTLIGTGRVAFVTGSAGQGKTTLMQEFARQAMVNHANLLVLSGSSNAYYGLGDPYMPFKESMATLTGDVESAWKAGALTREQARSLWVAFPQVISILLDYGRDLLEVIVPTKPLLSRAKRTSPDEAGWFQKLSEAVEQNRGKQEELKQSHLFEQITNVLCTVSESYPLIITLDDLHWGDNASISLLFHLARRIHGSRILLLCAYRPEEITQGREGDRHPLEKVISELQRQFGEIHVTLSAGVEKDGREFIDAFLDSETNRLDEDFRQTLFEKTGGHPLFTVELLRSMQERGDLVREKGAWITGPSVDWRKLPVRVEAVIEERISQLSDDLRAIMTIASVEGEDFTAQVVASIHKTNERNIIHQLSEDLRKRHRMVDEGGSLWVGNSRLHQFRFRHILFQQHLYNGLGMMEREILHNEVAVALETLYGIEADDIAPQLAYHFLKAGNQDKAIQYMTTAGHQAQSAYANQEAIEYYSQALDLVPMADLQAQYELLLARERALDQQGAREEQAADLEALYEIAGKLGDASKKAEVALRQSNYGDATTDYETAIEASQRAILQAIEVNDQGKEVEGHLALSLAYVRRGDYDQARDRLEEAMEKAIAAGLPLLNASTYALLGVIEQEQGNNRASIQHHQEALKIFRQFGDKKREAHSLNTLGNAYFGLKDYPEAVNYYEQALAIFRRIGNQLGQSYVLNNLGQLATNQGDYSRAKVFYEQALSIFNQIDNPLGIGSILINLGEIATFEGEYVLGRDYYLQALDIAEATVNRIVEVYALAGLADIELNLSELEKATEYFHQALEIRQDMRQMDFVMETNAGLARVFMAKGDLEDALVYVDQILDFLNVGNSVLATNAPLLIYLTCYRVLRACHDPRAEEVLDTAYRLLQEQAQGIAEETYRRTFLENIPWHQEIILLYEGNKYN